MTEPTADEMLDFFEKRGEYEARGYVEDGEHVDGYCLIFTWSEPTTFREAIRDAMEGEK